MKCSHEELPTTCRNCWNLKCSSVYMNGEGYYYCVKVPTFAKQDNTGCDKFIDIDE